MSLAEWFTLAGIILGIVSTFAIPLAVWMTKIWSSQRVQSVQLRNLLGRLKRMDRDKHDGFQQLTAQVITSNNRISDQMGTFNDRLNEHAEHIAVHETRLVSSETEIKELRMKQHQMGNTLQSVQQKN